MENKKIATAIDIMIKTANYEYIHITKYSEKSIAYDNKEEMVSKEDEHSLELVNDIVRTIRSIPNQLNKSTLTVVNEEAEKKIQKRIPEWLEVGPEPNIANVANTAKKNNDAVVAKIESEDSAKQESAKAESKIIEDLFDDKAEAKAEIKPKIKSESKKEDGISAEDLFGSDDDLFK